MKSVGSKLSVLGLLTVVAGVFACSSPPATKPGVALSIKSVTPDTVFTEGGDPVVVTTVNGCVKGDVKIDIGGVPIAASTIVSEAADSYKFPAPASASTQKNTTTLTLTCAKPAKAGDSYASGKNSDTHPFTYDPALEPNPVVTKYSPFGDRISVLAQMTVTFSRPMDPASVIAPGAVTIKGITGTTTYDAPTKTATFVPAQQLPYGSPEICVVLGGAGGVTSLAQGKPLATHLAPSGTAVDPNQDSWAFTTRCEGCGNPWLGDISAAAGISTGGNYKLFSVTGAPTPVGTAYAGTEAAHTYKLESGFLYATQPPTGN